MAITTNSGVGSFSFTIKQGGDFSLSMTWLDDNGAPMNLTDAHWIINNPAAANFFGSPFLGVSRNFLRGESVNAVNMSMFKNTKVTERLNMRFEFTAFNPFNMQYRGVPGLNVSRVSADPLLNTFGNNRGNTSGDFNPNATLNGLGARRLQFGAKFIF